MQDNSKESELNAAYNSGRLGIIDGRPISAETKRRCEMAGLYFLEYYCNHLNYVTERKRKTEEFKMRPVIANQETPESECEVVTTVRTASGEVEEKVVSSTSYNSQEVKDNAWKKYLNDETTRLRKWRTRVSIANFTVVRQVGQGGFGQVFLAHKNDTKELVALKKMSKKILKDMGEIQHILTERDILTRTKSDWLVRLFYAFQDRQNVYLAMEYVPGGDMRTLVNNSGCMREPHVKFYISEMIMAVSTLHDLGFIHRDLKPENFLIDRYGHLKLTDFGLSRGKLTKEVVIHLKERLEKIKNATLTQYSTVERRSIRRSLKREDFIAHSLVGSPDYMAPEILTATDGVGYSAAIDYWALGCIMYELLCGYPPFTAPTTDDIWVNVYHWKKVLERPIYDGIDEEFNLSDESWEAITHLIADVGERYTSLRQIQSLPFFNGVEFRDLRNNPDIRPPFVPSLTSATDTSHFDDFSNPRDVELYKEVQDRISQLQLNSKESVSESKMPRSAEENLRSLFVGFTFKHK